MNMMENYARAMRSFTQPCFAMMEAYAGFLKQMGGGKSSVAPHQPINAAPLSPRAASTEYLPRRAQALAAVRDAVKKDVALRAEPTPLRPAKKTAITHSAAVERANRAWATRRANAALEEKAARKAARQKARARQAR